MQCVLVLLLSTSVFGFPSVQKDNTGLGVLTNFVEGLTDGSDIQELVMDEIKKGVARIGELMKDVEIKIAEITKDIGVINSERSESLREAYTTYRRIKVTLKDSRAELFKLAVQTELKTSSLIRYMRGWDHEKYSSQEQKKYLKRQVKILKQLLEESNVALTDAKSKYDQAYIDFNAINGNIENFKVQMDLMLDEKMAELESWAANVRAGVYSAAAALTALFATLDFTVCFGLCSAIGTSVTAVASVTAAELEVHRVSGKIEEFQTTVLNSIESVNEITNATKGLQEFIEKETKKIIKWHQSVKHMETYVDDATQDDFYGLSLVREDYEANLVKLRDAAQEFIDQPENIFGEDVLEKVLNDPKRREQEHKERTALRAKALCAKECEKKDDYEACFNKNCNNTADD